MRTYVLQRLLALIPLLMGISLLSFFIINLAPGDFLTQMALNPQVDAATIEQLRAKFRLDRPWYVQYGYWLWNILHLDFGYAFSSHAPVFTLIRARLLATFILAFASSLIAWTLAIPLGVVAATHQNTSWDRLSSMGAFLGLSIPRVFFALLMIAFAARTGWFPVGGMRSLQYEDLSLLGKVGDLAHHLALPAIVLGTTQMAGLMRQMRGNLLDVLRADYVTTARAKGLSEQATVYVHALRNAINPLITLFGYTVASLLSGSFLVEVVMSWPGLARLVLDALFARDLYLVMGSVLMSSVLLVLGNLVADLLLAWTDPRVVLRR